MKDIIIAIALCALIFAVGIADFLAFHRAIQFARKHDRLDEWRAIGWRRFLPGSGFWLRKTFR